MKENTQRLLTWLYRGDHTEPAFVNYDQVEFLLPRLSPGGRRSLIHYLAKKYLIRTELIQGETHLALTTHGRTALAAEFPVFSPEMQQWSREWSLLMFLEAPSSDQHFRYLRSVLLEEKAISPRRGVYLFPGSFPSRVVNLCQDLYVGAVEIMTINEWRFGDELSWVNHHYMLSDIINIYSGISREINRLLASEKKKERLIHRHKNDIFSVFNRLFDNLKDDPGFIAHYYPDSPQGRQLLSSLQVLFMAKS